jgi:hypothetical protein
LHGKSNAPFDYFQDSTTNFFVSSTQGMTAFYGDFDRDAQETESLKTIATALDLGINLLDTAWTYQVREHNPSAQSSIPNLTLSPLQPCLDTAI